MGAVPSTPIRGAHPADAAEELIGIFVGEKSYPISSEFWKRLLELPHTFQWPSDHVDQACQIFLQNNNHTRHLAKILIHMVLSLQESLSTSSESSTHSTAINAVRISSIFLKYIIENGKSDTFEELHLSLHEIDMEKDALLMGQSIEHFVMQGVLTFIGTSNASGHSYVLHYELLNFILVAMSTQLRSGPSPCSNYAHQFIDAAMSQDGDVVAYLVRRLLLNFIYRPRMPFSVHYAIYSNGNQSGVLQKFGSAAANIVLLPYYTFNYLVSSSGEASRSPLAGISLHVLLVLVHYRMHPVMDGPVAPNGAKSVDPEFFMNKGSYFHENPYSKALNSARDIEFDRADIEGNAHSESIVRLPFASLFDSFEMFLGDESVVLLLYSFVHGNFSFLEYILVRTDLDTVLLPILETLYNASKKTPNQIYMLLIILLILSQDSSFNASIHKLMLASVPWYEERLVNHTSLGSLMVLVLIRIVKYNLSKLRDVYLHTNCLAILANMAPYVHKLSSYAAQRLVGLFYMLSRKYIKVSELKTAEDANHIGDWSAELHIYTDFLRIVLEILNAILTHALPQNPEVVYAVMHRQEVFQPFKSHPRFQELLENVFTVLDFFNSRMDKQLQLADEEWSVERVLEAIIVNCRSWRGEGMKIFTRLRFTYEQESHPEEFFVPYVWQLILLSSSSFDFNAEAISLFPVDNLAVGLNAGPATA